MSNKHLGSSFDDFLEEEDILNHAEAIAIKRVIAYQIEKAIINKNLTKTALANQMKTSRSELNRLLDPTNTSLSLKTLVKAANSINEKVIINFQQH